MKDAEAVTGALFALLADPVWIVAADLTVTRSNGAFDALESRLADRSFEQSWRELARRVFGGRSVMSDVRVVVDGVERLMNLAAVPVAGEGALFIARDITDTRRSEREDALELAVTRIFATSKPLERMLDDVLEFICESDNWDCGVIWLLDPGGIELSPRNVWTRAGVDASKFRERMANLRFGKGHGVPGRAWSGDDVVWFADLYDESGLVRAESAAAAGLHGAAAVPLRDSGEFVGVLELFTRAVRPMSEQGRRALVRAGSSLGRLIERRKLETLIERKGREWSLTFDAIELPIFITRLDGTITRVNRAARDLAGAGEFLDVLQRNIAVGAGEPWTTLTDIVAAVRDSHTPCTAHINVGDRTWDVSASWYWSEAEHDDRAIIVMRDTTDLVRLQESVRRGEQLAALGELVAGVAHEVRNPIFGMGLTVDALQSMLPDLPEFAELAGVLRTWLDRLNRLMENLLEYGKTWSLDLSHGSLDAVLTGVVERSRQIAPHVIIEARIEPDLSLLMDANRLGQAFENLITNAVQHSKPDQKVLVSAARLPDGIIECTVRDFGPGFEPLDLPRIFQPFFTRRRGGTGLGLSIVQRIVDEHGGTITAGNSPDGGALITMRFPSLSKETPDVAARGGEAGGADPHRRR
jgi:signal transduction histidine kinase